MILKKKKYKTKKIMQNKYNPRSERNLIVVKSATAPDGNKIIYCYDKTGFKKYEDNKENREKLTRKVKADIENLLNSELEVCNKKICNN